MDNEKTTTESRARRYGDLLYRRAVGESEEMESAKSLCEIVNRSYSPGDRVLDVGCGVGHYLRSLRARVDRRIDYTGVDINGDYIDLAKKAFPGSEERFQVGELPDLPFEDGAY
ncbi:MAG: class I SAM-dependent methyltransferase, partial [Acidobacteriota bacterium]|nr:class I SAM-dependent methyltransferase [Acidobacteriota bacterium]